MSGLFINNIEERVKASTNQGFRLPPGQFPRDQNAEQSLQDIDQVWNRLATGAYGICSGCDKKSTIHPARLGIIPASIFHKNKQGKTDLEEN